MLFHTHVPTCCVVLFAASATFSVEGWTNENRMLRSSIKRVLQHGARSLVSPKEIRHSRSVLPSKLWSTQDEARFVSSSATEERSNVALHGATDVTEQTTLSRLQSSAGYTGAVSHVQPNGIQDLSPEVKEGRKAPVEHLDEFGIGELVKRCSDYTSAEEYFEANNISSRPVAGANWNVEEPLKWTQTFGRRSPGYEKILESLIKLGPGDEGYFDVSDIEIDNVTIVRTKEQAKIVLKHLYAADPLTYHACDTEVMDIDLGSVGPVGNGYVTCVSIYSGPNFDYGLGQGPGTTLWIDNLDDSCGLLQDFKDWFENDRYLKVWHNYGFDRHVMWNEGIDVRGFGGDTMHMARLQDTSRVHGGGGYGLEALTSTLVGQRKVPMKEIFGIKRLRKDGSEGNISDMPPVEVMQRERKHRSKWILYSAYDAEGTWLIREELDKKLSELPWMLGKNLMEYYWMHMRPFGEVLTDMERRGIRVNANDYLAKVEIQAREDRIYHANFFRKWAAEKIGADGLAMNMGSSTQLGTFLFGGAKNSKTGDPTETVRIFKVPRVDIAADALKMYEDQKTQQSTDNESSGNSVDLFVFESMTLADLKDVCREYKLKVSGKKDVLKDRIKAYFADRATTNADGDRKDGESVDEFDSMNLVDLRDALVSRGLPILGKRHALLKRIRDDIEMTKAIQNSSKLSGEEGKLAVLNALENAAKTEGSAIANYLEKMKKNPKINKFVDVTITSLGLTPEKFTMGGAPSVTSDVLRSLAGEPFNDPPKYGTAFEQLGKEGCEALFSLCAIGSIDTMLANFITSLQELADDQSRVHCSLNLNTETGRLSSRRPNLQNQPALEKDKYKIRKAFEASPGNNLIVADYGQLELRILASLTNCRSMIDAFKSGGDFHSRTAMDMFPYIKEKLDAGECLLEWDYSNGDPPKPMLKDVYASERRKAKTLNFSIAYGKTAHGLSKDWDVSLAEAEKMLQAWYEARPEVAKWQQETKDFAKSEGLTRTLMGRYRQLPNANNADAKRGYGKALGNAMRASINTPIQGGAADIAMMAMNKINQSQKLKQLGWVLLLQIHDEVILEGPEETAEEAFEEVRQCMESPWVFGLRETAVPLLVDGSFKHKTWYEAK